MKKIIKTAAGVLSSCARRIRDESGESLLEVLVAILVVVLSGLLLMPLFTASVKLNQTAEREDERYFNELTASEQRSGGEEKTGELTITIKTDGKWTKAEQCYYNSDIINKNSMVAVVYHYLDDDGESGYSGELVAYTLPVAGGG